MDFMKMYVLEMLAHVPHLLVASPSPLLLDPITFVNLVLMTEVISIVSTTSSFGMGLAAVWLEIPVVHSTPLLTSLYNFHQLQLMISMDDSVVMRI